MDDYLLDADDARDAADRLKTERRNNPEPTQAGETGAQTTTEEEAAIRSLQRLAKKWPSTLLLASMGGSLVVMHTDDEAFHSGEGPERSANILACIFGIPNDGGDW